VNIVWFDLETTGLSILRDEVIQVAAVATGGPPAFKIREKIEVKIQPTPTGVGRLNRLIADGFETVWDAETWEKVWTRDKGFQRVANFFRRYADIQVISKKGRPYKTCRVAGHNVSKFDVPMLFEHGKKLDIFMPINPICLDTFQLACSNKILFGVGPDKLTIEGLCRYYNIPVGTLHDALEDVLMNIEIARRLVEELADWE
jgi:DNA polymerase III alpha subunit (gram-positive type)